MGLFDGKKKNVDDEQPRAVVAEESRPATSSRGPTAAQKQGTPARFGIDRAIQLMRTMPMDQHPELVAIVIANTLASLDVKVADIIEDATLKERDLEGRIEGLKAKNRKLESEIELGVDEIVKLEASLAEITSTKERLQLAATTTSP